MFHNSPLRKQVLITDYWWPLSAVNSMYCFSERPRHKYSLLVGLKADNTDDLAFSFVKGQTYYWFTEVWYFFVFLKSIIPLIFWLCIHLSFVNSLCFSFQKSQRNRVLICFDRLLSNSSLELNWTSGRQGRTTSMARYGHDHTYYFQILLNSSFQQIFKFWKFSGYKVIVT